MLQFAILFEAQLQCSEEYYNSADTEAANFQIFRFYFNSFFSVSLKNVENKSSYINWHYWYTSLMSSVFGQLTC